eukprot:13227027-Alexandrium_andersonii.AAC.1
MAALRHTGDSQASCPLSASCALLAAIIEGPAGSQCSCCELAGGGSSRRSAQLQPWGSPGRRGSEGRQVVRV